MADSSNNSTSSPADRPFTVHSAPEAPPGLSLSRRVKIGVVLLLMLCGYFLMGERPRPAPITAQAGTASAAGDAQMQQFIDNLDFVEAADSSTPPSAPADRAPLQLPAAAPPPADNAMISQRNVPSAAASGMTAPSPPVSSSYQHSAYSTYSQARDVRTVLRFTGRIEPLR